MMRSIKALVLLAYAAIVQAADPSPRDLAQAFFSPKGIADRSRLYSGEMRAYYMKTPTMGETLPRKVNRNVRTPLGSGQQVVVPVTLSDGDRSEDYYMFVERGQFGWTISAIRALALAGVPYEVHAELARKPKRSSEEQWTPENLGLLFRNDEQLKLELMTHLGPLRLLAQHVAAGNTHEVNQRTRELRCLSARKDQEGRILVTIGGVLDNTVGFMYVPPDSKVPEMSPSAFIYIEHVKDGWYLFKTT